MSEDPPRPVAHVDFGAEFAERFKSTQNPVDAWDAIAYGDLSKPLSPEVAAYLKQVAIALGGLGGAVHNFELEASDAAKLVPMALGITTKDGFNAFAVADRDNDASWTSSSFKFLSRKGNVREAMEELIAERRPRTAKDRRNARDAINRQLDRAKKNRGETD